MRRFTIKQLMLTVCFVAGLLALYQAIGPPALIVMSFSLCLTGLGWLAVSGHPRRAAWTFAVSACLANVSVGIICAYLYSLGGIILMVLASTLTIPQAIGCGSAWAAARSPTRRLPREAAWLIVAALSLLPLSMMLTLWPLRLAFLISRPAMDRLADRVAAGEAVMNPEWAGLYYVVGTKREPSSGNIALIIDADTAGNSGFVRKTGSADGSGPMTNLNFNEHVGGRWRYQNED
jgi:hypothetical protein